MTEVLTPDYVDRPTQYQMLEQEVQSLNLKTTSKIYGKSEAAETSD